MVQVLEPPVAETESPRKKRGGGPRTPEGRRRSREGAVKTSLRSKVLFSKDLATRILDRNAILKEQCKPTSRYETMLVADMALAKARSDRAAELLVENEDRNIERSVDFWNHDQKMRALHLRKRLGRNPAWIAHELSGFKQGAELLISEWEGLAAALAGGREWDEQQRRLALDLRGVRVELRAGNPLFATGASRVSREKMAAMAAEAIGELRHAIESWLDVKDLDSQDDTLVGLGFEQGLVTRRLQRYEAMAKRDYEKKYAELLQVQAQGNPNVQEKDIPLGPRAWDEDSLIARIKAIQEPPALRAEHQDATVRGSQPDELSDEAKAPVQVQAPAVVAPDRPTVAPDNNTPAPAAPETDTESEAPHSAHDACNADDEAETGTAADALFESESESEGEIESPMADAPANPHTPSQSIVPPPMTTETIAPEAKTPLSRQARKLLQRQHHEAERKAARDGQKNRHQPQTC